MLGQNLTRPFHCSPVIAGSPRVRVNIIEVVLIAEGFGLIVIARHFGNKADASKRSLGSSSDTTYTIVPIRSSTTSRGGSVGIPRAISVRVRVTVVEVPRAFLVVVPAEIGVVVCKTIIHDRHLATTSHVSRFPHFEDIQIPLFVIDVPLVFKMGVTEKGPGITFSIHLLLGPFNVCRGGKVSKHTPASAFLFFHEKGLVQDPHLLLNFVTVFISELFHIHLLRFKLHDPDISHLALLLLIRLGVGQRMVRNPRLDLRDFGTMDKKPHREKTN
mmetsp:Transcript_34171/g.53427  ORF Transcript_34171/g.53427 Transcript_34171/m.53427 type:complete len:273 (-) Transcript_34171:119-937(-)